ncbi:hypothetical protein [Chryseolinea lacunae]|uniref:DUF4625 domain-containing protein n=1 Tax=Chryseolinea lacunae TaxID=2801331 RepID=A0ABS1KN72_9BACT|nr:hypothetical protein [Chryseolinea lacunae]MBL0740697.1 hypothetical protein [Chryseolinea lacunae]
MKTTPSLLLLLLVSILSSCSFSAGTNKDFKTGLSYSYNGFGLDQVYFVGPEDKIQTDNKVDLNSKVAIVVEGLRNYALKDDKASPGLKLAVTDKEGKFIINEADLFAGGEGYTPEQASVLRGTVTVGSPMQSGEKYKINMKVWDKNKPENEFTAEVEIDVK